MKTMCVDSERIVEYGAAAAEGKLLKSPGRRSSQQVRLLLLPDACHVCVTHVTCVCDTCHVCVNDAAREVKRMLQRCSESLSA